MDEDIRRYFELGLERDRLAQGHSLGFLRGLLEETGWDVVEADLAHGQHRPGGRRVELFTAAYFHGPDELRAEVEEAGFLFAGVFGVEGPGSTQPDAPVDRGRTKVVRSLAWSEARLRSSRCS
jgi:hypothetical protein